MESVFNFLRAFLRRGLSSDLDMTGLPGLIYKTNVADYIRL